MRSLGIQTLRSRWFAVGLHAGLWLLLCVAITSLGGNSPIYREADSVLVPPQSPAPVAKLTDLFSPGSWPKTLGDTNTINPFYTRHFIPPQTPVPPPPTTRKIELTYQGFYETSDNSKRVIVKLGDAFLVAAVGTKVTANLYAVQATMQALTLTNPAAQTNVLLLNTKKEIEVPIP